MKRGCRGKEVERRKELSSRLKLAAGASDSGKHKGGEGSEQCAGIRWSLEPATLGCVGRTALVHRLEPEQRQPNEEQ